MRWRFPIPRVRLRILDLTFGEELDAHAVGLNACIELTDDTDLLVRFCNHEIPHPADRHRCLVAILMQLTVPLHEHSASSPRA